MFYRLYTSNCQTNKCKIYKWFFCFWQNIGADFVLKLVLIKMFSFIILLFISMNFVKKSCNFQRYSFSLFWFWKLTIYYVNAPCCNPCGRLCCTVAVRVYFVQNFSSVCVSAWCSYVYVLYVLSDDIVTLSVTNF